MACPNAPQTALNVVVKIDNAAGTPVDVSNAVTTFEFGFENTMAEFRSFGNQWKCRAVVGKDAPLSMSGIVTGNDAEVFGLLRGWFFDGVDSARTISVEQPDANPGGDTFSGEYLLNTLTLPGDAEADDFQRWSAEFMPTGTVSHSEISS